MHAVLAVFTGFGAISNSCSRGGGNTGAFNGAVDHVGGFTIVDGGGIHAIQRFLTGVIPFRAEELYPKADVVVGFCRI